MSKSKQMLKKYISEINGIRESKFLAPHEKHAPLQQLKIAAPKPVRARPLGFAHNVS